jgi:aminoglycoside 2'-N-acetyltransferase I
MASLVVRTADGISPEEAKGIAALIARTWPRPERPVEEFAASIRRAEAFSRGRAPEHILAKEGGRLVGHAATALREVRIGEVDRTVLALAGVCVEARLRGSGLGREMVQEAFNRIERGDAPIGLFQTTEAVRPFYERLGSRVIDAEVVNSRADDPKARAFWDPVVMIHPGHAPWPRGTIDLLGPGW